MTDRAERTNEQGDEQLFQGMDERERIYSPQEVPDSDIPEEERDKGGTAAEGPAVATDQGE